MSSVRYSAGALGVTDELRYHRIIDTTALSFTHTHRNTHGVTSTSGRGDVIASGGSGVRGWLPRKRTVHGRWLVEVVEGGLKVSVYFLGPASTRLMKSEKTKTRGRLGWWVGHARGVGDWKRGGSG